MHRNCRAISVFRNQCACRHLATASATQLKVSACSKSLMIHVSNIQKPKQPEATSRSPTLPTPKSWSRPPQLHSSPPLPSLELPKRKDWSRPSPSTIHSSPKESPPSQQAFQVNKSSISQSQEASVPQLPRPSNHIPTPKQWSIPSKATPSTTTFTPPKATFTPPVEPSTSASSTSQPSTAPAPNRSLNPQYTRWLPTESTKLPNLGSSDIGVRHAKPLLNQQRPQHPIQKQSAGRVIEKQSRSVDNKFVAVKSQVKQKPLRKRGRRRDVFIPSTLTVATLASVLKIKLGNLTHKTVQLSTNSVV